MNMTRDFPESDWKVFCELRKVALERFCKQFLEQVKEICDDELQTNHERYISVWKLTQKRDKDIARMFDAPRRANMLWQLQGMLSHNLISKADVTRFSEVTREAINFDSQDLI